MASRWTPEEDSLLREIYPHNLKATILEKIGKPWTVIHRRAIRLHLHRDKSLIDENRTKHSKPRCDSCSPEEAALLKEIYEHNSKEYTLSRFKPYGRSWQSIRRYAKFMGLDRDIEIVRKEMLEASQKGANTIKWPENETALLKSIYASETKKNIMASLPGRTWRAIREHAIGLGLRRNEDIIIRERNEANQKTIKSRYGVDYSTQLRTMQKKSRQTNLELRGVEYPSQSAEVREKVRQAVQKEYGVDNMFQSEEIKEKSRETMTKKHGKPNPMQVPEIRERAFNTAKENGLLPASDKELVFYEFLKQVDPLNEHHVFHPVAHHVIDFYSPQYDIWIQFDGDYWHGRHFVESDNPQSQNIKKKMENDAYQNKTIPNLVRFWESDIDKLIQNKSVVEYVRDYLEAKKNNGIVPCYQYRRKMSHKDEDLKRLPFDPHGLKASNFDLQKESLNPEITEFIKKYEWFGKIGNTPRWCFTARYKGHLAGAVLINEPNAYSNLLKEKHEDPLQWNSSSPEALIQRGASSSWAPKNLSSRLIRFACKWMVTHTKKRAFVCYADPKAQEIGIVYQACNFEYLGSNFGTRILLRHPFISSGIPFPEQSLRRTSSFRRWCRENNIALCPSWFQENGFKKLSAIPEEIKTSWYAWVRQKVQESEKIPTERKHKYILVLGKDKREQRYLDSLKTYKTKPYPKQNVLPYVPLPPLPPLRKKKFQPSRRTPEKIGFIINNYDHMTQKELATAIGETKRWVDAQIRMLVKDGKLATKHGIGSTKSRKDPEKISYIITNYGKMTREEMARSLDETARWVKRQINNLRNGTLVT